MQCLCPDFHSQWSLEKVTEKLAMCTHEQHKRSLKRLKIMIGASWDEKSFSSLCLRATRSRNKENFHIRCNFVTEVIYILRTSLSGPLGWFWVWRSEEFMPRVLFFSSKWRDINILVIYFKGEFSGEIRWDFEGKSSRNLRSNWDEFWGEMEWSFEGKLSGIFGKNLS